MKRYVLLSVIALIASFILSKTILYATTAAEEDHGGDIVYTKPIMAVIFSHKAHTEDIGMQCEWCHDETFEMEALAVEAEENFNMESLCNENYCGTCHNGDISFSTTVQCARCHIGKRGYDRMVKEGKIEAQEEHSEVDITSLKDGKTAFPKFDAAKVKAGKDDEALEKMIDSGYFPDDIVLTDNDKTSSAIFSHKKHTEREKISCTTCHPYVFLMKVDNKVVKKGQLSMEQMEKGKYCGSCHDGDKAFSVSDTDFCKNCHPDMP